MFCTPPTEIDRSCHWAQDRFWEVVLADPDLLDAEFAETAAGGGLLDLPRRPACRLFLAGRPGHYLQRASRVAPAGPTRPVGHTAPGRTRRQRGPPGRPLPQNNRADPARRRQCRKSHPSETTVKGA